MGIFSWAADLCPPSATLCTYDRMFFVHLATQNLGYLVRCVFSASGGTSCYLSGCWGLFSVFCPRDQWGPCCLDPSGSILSGNQEGYFQVNNHHARACVEWRLTRGEAGRPDGCLREQRGLPGSAGRCQEPWALSGDTREWCPLQPPTPCIPPQRLVVEQAARGSSPPDLRLQYLHQMQANHEVRPFGGPCPEPSTRQGSTGSHTQAPACHPAWWSLPVHSAHSQVLAPVAGAR